MLRWWRCDQLELMKDWKASSWAMMVVGGIMVVGRVGFMSVGMVDAGMMGGLELDSDALLEVDLEVAEGSLGENPGLGEGYF